MAPTSGTRASSHAMMVKMSIKHMFLKLMATPLMMSLKKFLKLNGGGSEPHTRFSTASDRWLKIGEKRIRYILDHLNELHTTIEEGIPVLGYFHWSLFDNFEWSDGYNMHFGLYRVNHETKERIPTNAAKIYMKIALNNALY